MLQVTADGRLLTAPGLLSASAVFPIFLLSDEGKFAVSLPSTTNLM